MAFVSATTRVMVFAGSGFAVVDVRRGLGGWATREVCLVRDADEGRQLDAAREAVRRAGRASRSIAVVDASKVHARPMAMTSRVFRDAKDGVRSSLDELLPIDGVGAVIGYVDRAGDARDDGGSGYLLAIDGTTRERIDRISTDVLGDRCDRIVAPHQAAVCLGENASDFTIAEIGALGDRQDTVVRDGALVELRRNAAADEPGLTLPQEVGAEFQREIMKLATGAAALDRFCSHSTEPLAGSWTPAWKRAMPVVAAAGVCTVLLIGALSVRGQRYASAIDRTLAAQQAIREEVVGVERLEAEASRLRSRLAASRLAGPSGSDSGLIGVLDALRGALPGDAFLESVTVDDAGLRLRGVASNAREVLGALEASEDFESVREVERPQPVGDGSQREVFDVRVAIRSTSERAQP